MVDRFMVKWMNMLIEDLEEASHRIPDSLYNGELEDLLAEIHSLLQLTGMGGEVAGRIEDLIHMSRNMRVRITSSGSYRQPGMDLIRVGIARLLEDLSRART